MSSRELEAVAKADALDAEVVRLYNEGSFSRAIDVARQALAVNEQAYGIEHPSVARSLNNLAALYRAQGAHSKAEPLYERALSINENTLGAEHPNLAMSLNNLAVLYQEQGAYDRAEPLYERTLRINQKVLGDEHPDVATSLNNLAVLYQEQGAYNRAEPLLQRALRIREKALGTEHSDVATSLDSLAGFYRDQGAYDRAEPLLQRALRIREKARGPEHPDVATSLNNLALLYRVQGAYDRAEPIHERALRIREKMLGAEHPDVATSLNNLAVLYRDQGAYDRAEPLYERALRINEQVFGAEHPDVATSLNNLAVLYRDQGAYDRARPLHERALRINEKALGAEHPDVATSPNNLALLYQDQSAHPRAESLLQRALCISERTLGAEHPDVATSLNNLAVLLWITGDVSGAVRHFARVVALRERRLGLTLATLSEPRKRQFLQTQRSEAEVAVSFHAHGAPNDADALALTLTATLRRKGRLLAEVTSTQAALQRNLSPELKDESAALQQRRVDLATLRRAAADPRRAEATRTLARDIEQLEGELSRKSASFRASDEPATIASVQAALPNNTTLVEFVHYRRFDPSCHGQEWKEARYVAYVLQHEGPPRWVALGEAAPIEAAVAAALAALTRPERDPCETLRALDELIFAPIRRQLGPTENFLLAPDAALHLVPFAALVDEDRRYLVEYLHITYLTSGRDLLRVGAQDVARSKPLVMAAPDYSGRCAPLPGAEVEAEALRQHFTDVESYVGQRATKERLTAARGPLFVHVATHGFFRMSHTLASPRAQSWRAERDIEGVPSFRLPPTARPDVEDALDDAGLIFAGASEAEACLTARQIASIDLRGTQLVVLSACDTGIGQIASSEGVYGLRRALIIAGAETQVVSLWKVDDGATSLLMERYYGGLRSGAGRSEALQHAQQGLLRDGPLTHPFYWAAFVPIGDDGPLQPDRAARPSAQFSRSLAVVIGINTYGEGIPPLRSAVADAKAIAETLRRSHAFETWCLIEEDAQLSHLLTLLHDKLPSALGPDDRLLLYFAGHGIALDSDAGPGGYLIPAGAPRAERDGFLPMRVVHAALAQLPVRHVFVILDCCFAGAFRWAHMRDVGRIGEDKAKIYRERYDRYIESPAWQVLTSASSDQRAFDVLANDRAEGTGEHSPFACALLAGLAGEADYTKDNVITADELAIYVRERVAPAAKAAGSRQVPQLFALERHDAGQFVFQVPNRPLAFAAAPVLNENTNPYRGLGAFREQDHALFFGREEHVKRLLEAVDSGRLTVVVGPSGSGKSSLVQAGLVPALRAKVWRVLPTQRPGREPLAVLEAWTVALGTTSVPGDPITAWAAAVAEQARTRPDQRWLVIVDQFEELLTHRTVERDRLAFLGALASALQVAPKLHLVVTVRSDAESQFHDTALAPWWGKGRFPMRTTTRDELRQMIERPASIAVLHFEPSRLVERLLDDVALVPAPLPLLSFVLSELYRCCWARWLRGVRDRALHETDYSAMGSVARALTQRASAVHDQLVADDAAYAITIRNVFTRMVSLVGADVARRRVPLSELVYQDAAENRRVAEVLQRFHEARLISLGSDDPQDHTASDEPQDHEASAYAEPTHDELVRGWTKVNQWLDELDASIGTRALTSLGDAVRSWNGHGQVDGYLWNDARVELLNERRQTGTLLLNEDETRFVARSAHRRRSRRVRLIGGLLTAIVVLAVAGGVAVWQQRLAQQRLAMSYMEQGRALLMDEHPMQALPYLFAARSEGMESSALRMLFAQASRNTPLAALVGHSSAVVMAAFSADGTRVVTASWDHTARVWDARTGEPVTGPLEHQGVVMAAAFSPDGTRVLASGDNTARLWDARTGKLVIAPLEHGSLVTAEAFSPDGKRISTAGWDGTARVWEALTGELVTAALEHHGPLHAVAFSPDGTCVVTASADHTARVWDARTGKPVTSPLEHQDEVRAAMFSPDGTRVVTASLDHTARVWDARTGKPVTVPLRHPDRVDAAAFSPDGTRVLTTCGDGMARVWDAQTGERTHAYKGSISAAAFSPDGTRVATASWDGTARVWDARTGEPVTAALEHQGKVETAAFSPDGMRIVTASWDHTARVWEVRADERVTMPFEHHDEVMAAAFSPDGTRVVTASLDHTARVWDTRTGKPVTAPLEHQGPVYAAAFSPDGARAVTASEDHTARVWDARTGQPITPPLEHQDGVHAAVFSPDGTRVVTASGDPTKVTMGGDHAAHVWDAWTGRPVASIEHQGTVYAAAFSADGARVVTASEDHTARVWDAQTGKPITGPLKHQDGVLAAAFSPDGARVATASRDRTARVWDVRTGQPITGPLEHQNLVVAVAFSPDGTLVVTGSKDNTARVWNAQTGQPVTGLLHQGGPVTAAAFNPDGTLVVTASEDATARIWDAQTGKPITELLLHRGGVHAAAFSPDGKRTVTASRDHTARVWALSMDVGSLGEWQRLASCSSFALSNGALTENLSMCRPREPARLEPK